MQCFEIPSLQGVIGTHPSIQQVFPARTDHQPMPLSTRIRITLFFSLFFFTCLSKLRRLWKEIRKMALMGPEIDDSLKAKLENIINPQNALIMKMDRMVLIFDQEYEKISLDELRNNLPKQEPRIIAYPYDLIEDGEIKACYRTLIFVSPNGCNPRDLMSCASAVDFARKQMAATNSLSIDNVDDLTEQWLKNKLAK
ncbi:glia maturation factor gamma-like isoform X2 [Syngnathoides biaculeatus]|uniref:glia maturation factor gamma-like isoform X2 n=1 Tax=Syngnathoides biaculeatus TaxID=300417 RepID=UPI002ADD8F27|nr:glia maturation factor gamma-like isoform X2 [Syngnathoides biaculeatus]